MARPLGAKPNGARKVQLTDEQAYGIESVRESDGDGLVWAYAGSGKTFLLKEIALDNPTSKFFLGAYNRKIADEAKKTFPRNTTCRTLHSLAFATVGVQYKHKLNGPRQKYDEIGRILGVKGFKVNDDRFLRDWQIVALVVKTVQRFCYSADDVPGPQHVPSLHGTAEVWGDLSEYVAGFAIKMWYDLTQSKEFKISWGKSHDYYLKMWALTSPIIHTDYFLLDEAQDSNPLVSEVVMRQDCQKILVGDPFQQLYAWRGAVDAMAEFNSDWHCTLSQSFRFGEAIAAEGDKFLRLLGADKTLRGFDGIDSEVRELEHAKTVLCRTNATVVAEAMQVQEAGNTVGIVGGTGEILAFARAVQDLQNNLLLDERDQKPITHPDLMAFSTWEDVKQYVEEEGTDLRVLVDMVDRYGVNGIIRVAEQSVNEDYADVLVSTAHKAKGLEWDSVRIAGDFKEPVDPETGERKVNRAEFMLLYVAVTRAKRMLDCSAIDWINDWFTVENTNEPDYQGVSDDPNQQLSMDIETTATDVDDRVLQRARRRKRAGDDNLTAFKKRAGLSR